MSCPVCKIELSQIILHNVEIDYCLSCFGLWFEENELRLVKDNKDKNINWLDIDLWQDETKFKISCCQRFCPYCRVSLYELRYGDSGIYPVKSHKTGISPKAKLFNEVKIDVCNLCQGVWLDRGEFKKIIAYLKKRADYEILNNYTKNLAQEFWEIFAGPETLREEASDLLTVLKLLNYKLVVQYPKLAGIIISLPK
jgi:Zn-finger nucleic acid-binding protein